MAKLKTPSPDRELPVLDRITRIARRMFDVPGSAVAVFDGDRAFLPGASGDLPTSLPREHTLCRHTLDTASLVMTSDATQVAEFCGLAAGAQRELLVESESGRARAAQTALLPERPLRVGEWSVT
ncbi:hypothetical protein BHE97_07480 [Aeromicrobium sp. PE09-221]|uniref:hypothetical protein n=1 Tax=Aeromicrobium sp. PE09-221 TaxID=1898043 RepID=UPI000B3EAE57|nr:hypothetical protein [Aeromicrobium sp. PE09-221]OUZ10412.1 hypothetical protein BHE97_07480 [Aeromicrobium sp. PE09-221]